MFLLSKSVVVVTLRVWFPDPAGEEVAHCIVTNVLGHLAKLEEIPGGGGGRGRERRKEVGRGREGGGRESQ